MKILIFLDTDHLSGPARLALDFSVEAQRMGHEVRMLGLTRGSVDGGNAFTRAIRDAGIELSMIRERFRFDPSVVHQFKAQVHRFRPDAYQSHGYKGSVLGLVARRMGLPWQAIFHGFTWENLIVRLYHALDVFLMRWAGEAVAVSRPFACMLNARGIRGERIRWIPNAISEQSLRRTDSGENLARSWFGESGAASIKVGVLGRFSAEKGPDLFIEAFALALKREPAMQAVMVGDGPLLDQCRAQATSAGIDRRITFPGFRTDLAAIYQALDIMVIPSRSEGMPTVLLEAMLMGVPVISTRVGAVPDVVRDGQTAMLTPIGDTAALADAIGLLASDAGLRNRLARNARRLAQERLTVEQRTATLLEHLACLIHGRPIPQMEWNDHLETETTGSGNIGDPCVCAGKN